MTEIIKTARLSECGTYRWYLARRWAPGPLLPFIMLNPSTADHAVDDATIRRCMSFARREGAAGIGVVNLYAFRATDPEEMKKANDPFGCGNAQEIADLAAQAIKDGMPIVCAWGAKGDIFGGHTRVVDHLQRQGARLVCLGATKSGMPKHPLYVSGDQPFIPYP